MQTIKGPAIFLAQFLGDQAPFNSLKGIAQWAANLGYKGVQIPTWDKRVFDLDLAATSLEYCDQVRGTLAEYGLEVVELASYLQGQVLAIPQTYELLFQGFYPQGYTDSQRQAWATNQLLKSVKASANMGTRHISVLSGGLAWPYVYPWPQRSPGLIDDAFAELIRRWLPILNAAQDQGITFGYELHPGSDLFDGSTYQRFLEMTNGHQAACLTYDPSHFLLQQIDYVGFIKIFADRIKAFHVKDAEYTINPMNGVYGGFNDWRQRAGRFRSLGDGQVDFKQIFTALTEASYQGWAIMEWECCIKSPEQGAREGAPFIQKHIIEATTRAFDDFAKGTTNKELNARVLGLT
jgi:sugar phosphate isomerase/epimerase